MSASAAVLREAPEREAKGVVRYLDSIGIPNDLRLGAGGYFVFVAPVDRDRAENALGDRIGPPDSRKGARRVLREEGYGELADRVELEPDPEVRGAWAARFPDDELGPGVGFVVYVEPHPLAPDVEEVEFRT